MRYQLDLEVAPHRACALRVGAFQDPARDGKGTLLIDTDVFHLEARPFESALLHQTSQDLHDIAVGLFQQVITGEYLQQLKS